MTFQFSNIAAGDARIKVPAIGLELRVCMEPSTTDNAMTIIETSNAPGFGPPLHRHAEAEIFHVLEGCYLFDVDGKRFEANVGDTVTVPGGIPHGFLNLADQPSRQLILIVPGLDATAFFTELGDVMRGGRPNAALQKAFAVKWGVDFLGPPIPLPDARPLPLIGN
jgi:quercetin dioxygenase-like cupin family protein